MTDSRKKVKEAIKKLSQADILDEFKETAQPILQKLDKIVEGVKKAEILEVAIITHKNPDPDAISSSVAVKTLLQKKGIPTEKIKIFAEENYLSRETKTLKDLLNAKVNPLSELSPKKQKSIILVDTKSLNQTNLYLKDVTPDIVIDHHDEESPFASSATIVTLLMCALDMEIDENLATALAIGIETDTDNCTAKKFTKFDTLVYRRILNPLINDRVRKEIANCGYPDIYRKMLSKAISDYYHKQESIIISGTGFIKEQQVVNLAKIANFLLKEDEVEKVIIMAIVEINGSESIVLSVRTSAGFENAGILSKKVFGEKSAGGTTAMAGGEVKLDPITVEIIRRAKENEDEKRLDVIFRSYLELFLQKALEKQEQ